MCLRGVLLDSSFVTHTEALGVRRESWFDRPIAPRPSPLPAAKMHLSMFAVNGGHGFVGAARCLELIRRGALEVCSLGLHNSSSWSQ
ncbi:hypothetical protein ZWY2020_017187 [Hordeum vulgare]|nr:hypothetical protein ZWY2020_017187 [Hordeum vulgare]